MQLLGIELCLFFSQKHIWINSNKELDLDIIFLPSFHWKK